MLFNVSHLSLIDSFTSVAKSVVVTCLFTLLLELPLPLLLPQCCARLRSSSRVSTRGVA